MSMPNPFLTSANTVVQFASVRIIAEDLQPLVRFYEAVTGATAQWLTDDFVELVTPSATVAISHSSRVAFLGEDSPRAAANNSVIYEFLVEDVEALYSTLQARLSRSSWKFGDDGPGVIVTQ
jgi:hypothetical protein